MHTPTLSVGPGRSLSLLVTAGVLWGTGGVVGTALADATSLAPPAVAAYRLGVGGLLLVVVSRALGFGVPRGRARWTRIATVGVLAAVFQGAYFAATASAGVAAATLVTIGSAPVFVVAIESAGARARPPAAVLRTVAVGIAGLALLVGSPATGDGAVLGAVFALVSGAAFAGVTIISRRPVAGSSDASTAGWAFVVGGAALATVSALTGGTLEFTPTWPSVWLLALFAVVPTAVAYTAFFAGLRGAGAATAAVVALLEPLTATVLATVLLGERLTAAGVVGAVLLLASVVDAGWIHARGTRRDTVGPS